MLRIQQTTFTYLFDVQLGALLCSLRCTIRSAEGSLQHYAGEGTRVNGLPSFPPEQPVQLPMVPEHFRPGALAQRTDALLVTAQISKDF